MCDDPRDEPRGCGEHIEVLDSHLGVIPREAVSHIKHMWVEFVVDSRPCSEGFSLGSPVFLPPQKPTLLNSNSMGNPRPTGLPVLVLGLINYLFNCNF